MPVPPERRLELASDAWIDAAGEAIQAAIDALPDAGTLSFSLCERYSNAPASVCPTPDGSRAWWARCENGRASTGAGHLDAAEVRIEGAYHAVLPIARTVFGDDASEPGRTFARVRGWFSDDAPRVAGTFQDPRASAVTARLHDALATRTIDDPDLASRIERQGLGRAVADLDEHGFAVLEDAIPEREADELREAILERVAEDRKSLSAAMLMERGRIFEHAALHPWLMSLAEHVCGKGFLMAQLLGLRRPTGPSTLGLHSDYNLIREPFPAHRQACTAIWALEDFTLPAGPTVVVRGSHREKRHPLPDDAPALTPILMPKGSIALWDGATWHAQADRTLPGDRVTLHSTYSRMTLRTYDFYRDIDPAILDRNPPELTTLAGLDDVFEKNRYSGPDFRRLQHAMAHFRT